MSNERLEKRLMSLRNSNVDSKMHDLHRILYDDAIWYLAYQNIYSNKGAFTVGIDESDTLDNFDKNRIQKIINSLKDDSYKPNPVRRVLIPKANGKTRPLGIPSGNDKLVQEACKIILEALYDNKFSYYSHGFRPNHSCHTALNEISKWTGTKWWIEFDIKGYFDNINHNILIDILSTRIDCPKFLDIIRRFLNAGYLENWKYHNTFSGTPQGGGISPILANIYLDKFDEFIENKCELINNTTYKRKINPRYSAINALLNYYRKKLVKRKNELVHVNQFINKSVNTLSIKQRDEVYILFKELIDIQNDPKYVNCGKVLNTKKSRLVKRLSEDIENITKFNIDDIKLASKFYKIQEDIIDCKNEIDTLLKEQRSIKSTLTDDGLTRLKYVRYADDFVLGFIGTKNQAKEIFNEIEVYLKDNLKLEISLEKSNIVYGIDGIKFLGYRIEMPKYSNELITVNRGDTRLKRRRVLTKPVLKVPTENAIRFVSKRGYGSYVNHTSHHRTYLQNFDDIEIIRQYNSELRGIMQYYKYAVNSKDIINNIQGISHYSLLKTLGLKHKCSVSQLFKRGIVKTKRHHRTGKVWYLDVNDKHIEIFNIKDIEYTNISEVNTNFIISDVDFKWQINQRSSALRKLLANECEICGSHRDDVNIVLHHPNPIRNIPKDNPYWLRVFKMRARKTIAICHTCHMKIHHGSL